MQEKKCCGKCRWWDCFRDNGDVKVGICIDAIERAKKVVPICISLADRFVHDFNGAYCPCFEPRVISKRKAKR